MTTKDNSLKILRNQFCRAYNSLETLGSLHRSLDERIAIMSESPTGVASCKALKSLRLRMKERIVELERACERPVEVTNDGGRQDQPDPEDTNLAPIEDQPEPAEADKAVSSPQKEWGVGEDRGGGNFDVTKDVA